MSEPRIYTYKITFPNQGWWYWGAHKERKAGEEYWGSPKIHKDKWMWFEYEKQILEYHETWEDAIRVEQRLILPDLDNPMCLNEGCGGLVSAAFAAAGGRIGGLAPASEAQKAACRLTGLKYGGQNFRDPEKQKERSQRVFDRKIGIWNPEYAEAKKNWCSQGGKKCQGKKWFNNGSTETLAFICPDGFRRGRLKR